MCPKRCHLAFTLKLGICVTFIGTFILISWYSIFQSIWIKYLELSPGSESYKLWLKTPMPLYMELYLFNWTNSGEFMKSETVKPSFNEIGPFTFQETHERVNVTYNSTTLNYNQTRTWVFLPNKSVNLTTSVTNLNVIAFTIAKAIENKNILVKELIDFLLHKYKEKVIVTRPAGEWLFDGIHDSLLDFIKKFNPDSVPFDKFGWFYGRNTSSAYDGSFSIETGNEDIYKLGSLKAWNNQFKTKYFSGECGKVRGTTTEIFPPMKKRQTDLTVFISDFCGPFTLNREGSTHIHGLEGYRFIGDERIFDNGTKYPESKCFCNDSCSPSGVRNETSCLGAPLYISFPHFYLADPVYVNSISGLTPNKSQHEFYLIINPLTGLPLEVRAQLQINLRLEPIRWVPMFSTVPQVYLPMMWFRQSINVTETLVNKGLLLETLFGLGYGVGCFLFAVGVLIVGVRLVRQYIERNKKEPLVESSALSKDCEEINEEADIVTK